MEQLLGTGERFFAELHRRSPVNVVRVIELEGTLPAQRVWSAVQALGSCHPRLRARVVGAGARARFTASAAVPIHFRVVPRTADTTLSALIEQALVQPISLEHGPLLHVSYVCEAGGRRSELVVVGAHAVCDGVSLNQLCSDLLALCAGQDAPAPSPEQPVLDSLLPNFALRQRGRGVVRALGRCARVSLGRTIYEKRESARGSAWLSTELATQTTSELLTSTRRAQTTLTGAVMAAALLAARRLRPSTPELSLSVPVNLRPHLPHAALGARDLGNYTTAAFLTSDAQSDFWTLARALKADLTAELAHGDALAAARGMYTCGRWLIGLAGAPLAHAMVSNSGVVELEQNSPVFRAIGFYSATSAPAVPADFSFFCNTFRGRLGINLVFSPEVISRAQAQAALTLVRELLEQAADPADTKETAAANAETPWRHAR